MLMLSFTMSRDDLSLAQNACVSAYVSLFQEFARCATACLYVCAHVHIHVKLLQHMPKQSSVSCFLRGATCQLYIVHI